MVALPAALPAVVLVAAAAAVISLSTGAVRVAAELTRPPAGLSSRGAPLTTARLSAGGVLRSTTAGRVESGRRRRIVGSRVLEVDFLEEKKIPRLVERGEGALKLQMRHHVTEGAVEASNQRQHEGPITDGITKLSEGARHRLQPTTIVGDVEGALLEVAELGGEEEGARFTLP
jgi:hypothetical protein